MVRTAAARVAQRPWKAVLFSLRRFHPNPPPHHRACKRRRRSRGPRVAFDGGEKAVADRFGSCIDDNVRTHARTRAHTGDDGGPGRARRVVVVGRWNQFEIFLRRPVGQRQIRTKISPPRPRRDENRQRRPQGRRRRLYPPAPTPRPLANGVRVCARMTRVRTYSSGRVRVRVNHES